MRGMVLCISKISKRVNKLTSKQGIKNSNSFTCQLVYSSTCLYTKNKVFFSPKNFNKNVCHCIDDRHFIFRILIRPKVINAYLIDYYPFATTFLCLSTFLDLLI
jgi:hypothetical protein